MPAWNVRRVKEDLPPVKIKVGSKPYVWAKVSGRLNDEATVTVFNTGTLHSGNQPWRDYKFSWPSIVKALNSDKPLKVY